jgi:hypothetical protein
MGSTSTYDLYVDDSGTRRLDTPTATSKDGPDAFALGGVLVASELARHLAEEILAFKARCGVKSYLRSYDIRQRKHEFAWINKQPDRAERLYAEIDALVERMPAWATAVVIDRPGYNARYREKYGKDRWELSKSAYDILIERNANIADADGRRLKVFVEETGKREDRLIRAYHTSLRTNGLQFQQQTSAKYHPLTPVDFARITMKSPQFTKKGNPLNDLADLVLFPLVLAKYNPDYRPYRCLLNAGKVIDCRLGDGAVDCGVKYYCFDDAKFGKTQESEKAEAHF